MKKIIHKDLSYTITGFCFQTQKKLGRFCRERQYADILEQLLKRNSIRYEREYEVKGFNPDSPLGNRVDFLIDGKIILDTKAKRFITKEDYTQMMRYLKCAKIELGLIVNFRDSYLKPKRILNSDFLEPDSNIRNIRIHSDHSDTFGSSDHSDTFGSSDREGYIALVTVLVTGAVGVAIAVSLLLLGLGSSRTSFSLEQSNQTKALANACAEEALRQIRDSTTFTGTGNLALGQGTCSYTVVNDGGENRTVTASGAVGTVIRKVKIIINAINPAITLTSWQELADF